MPDKMTDGRAEVGFPPMMVPFGLEAFMEINRPALAAMAQVNGKVYDNIATMNSHWVAFVNRRLQKELGMPRQLAACKTVQEMMACRRFLPDGRLRLPVRARRDEQARAHARRRDVAGDAAAHRGGSARDALELKVGSDPPGLTPGSRQ